MEAMDPQVVANQEYEEPTLLGAEDLQEVTGGCIFSCSNGDCKPN
jgi:hypothetical protein